MQTKILVDFLTVIDSTNLKSSIMRFLLTIATGICIGILIAPDKGSRTRKKITDIIKDLQDRFSDKPEETDQNEDVIIEEVASTIIITQ